MGELMIIFGLRIEGITYKIATALAALVLVSAGTLIWYVAPPWDPTHHEFSTTVTPDWALPPENDTRVPLDLMERILPIALVAFFVSAIGTALAVIFGWRAERRRNMELQLRVLQLESQIGRSHQGNETPS
jgi:hypothetical protein